VTISLAPTHVGYKQFTLQVDSHNEVEESNEKNNPHEQRQFIATIGKGSGGALYSLDGNFSARFRPMLCRTTPPSSWIC
jgi:hypothetical protein